MPSIAATVAQLNRLLRALFRRQLADMVARIDPKRLSAPSLDAWVTPMAESLLPLFTQLTQHGGQEAAKRIAAELKRQNRSLAEIRTKSLLRVVKMPRPEISFTLSPKVLEAVRTAVFAFCQSTLDTAISDVDTALATLREELAAGLTAGEATANLNRRVGEIFTDPFKSSRIAQTEVSRAVHSGGLLAAQESGVVKGLRWEASADACKKICLPLDGKVVVLGQPFFIDPKGGPYAVVNTAPAHPFLHVYRPGIAITA